MSETATRLRKLFALGVIAIVCASPLSASAKLAPNYQLYYNAGYNNIADPASDLRGAIAQADGRRILLEIGGDWCIWCKILDRYLADNTDVRSEFAQSFLIVRVHYHPRSETNVEFLSAYPAPNGFPAFIVLDASGKFLASQDTAKLETGESYSKTAMLAFARRWRTAP